MATRRFFRRTYTLRRHGEQKIVNGHAVNSYNDFTASLNVQPLSNSEANNLRVLSEGERTVEKLKVFGAVPIVSADEHSGTQGDLLYFHGKWYECKSSVNWIHSPLRHYETVFVIISDQSSQKHPAESGDMP